MSRMSVAMVTTALVFLTVPSSISYVFSADFAKKNLMYTTLAHGAEVGIPENTVGSDDSGTTDVSQNVQDTDGTPSDEKILWDTGWLRLIADADNQPQCLQTAIVTLICPATEEHPEIQVDLVSAMHIADSSYYQTLNQRFREYDTVLYELVAPKGSRPPKPEPGRKREVSSLVSSVQILLGESLGLSFQLEEVDYTVPNFVHADLTPEQFDDAMKQRQDGILKMFGRVLGYQMATGAGNANDLQLILALFSSNREQQFRRAFAESLADSEQLAEILDGNQEEGSAIIAARNIAAIQVLRERIAAGDRRIAIFYGGAHIPDLEQRITQEYDAVHDSVQWLTAWVL